MIRQLNAGAITETYVKSKCALQNLVRFRSFLSDFPQALVYQTLKRSQQFFAEWPGVETTLKLFSNNQTRGSLSRARLLGCASDSFHIAGAWVGGRFDFFGGRRHPVGGSVPRCAADLAA